MYKLFSSRYKSNFILLSAVPCIKLQIQLNLHGPWCCGWCVPLTIIYNSDTETVFKSVLGGGQSACPFINLLGRMIIPDRFLFY